MEINLRWTEEQYKTLSIVTGKSIEQLREDDDRFHKVVNSPDHYVSKIDGLKNDKSRFSPDHYVYFLRLGKFVKIGRTTDVKKRMLQHKTSNPFFYLLGIIRCVDEVDVHRFFKERVVPWSSEWFIFDNTVVDYVSSYTDDHCKEILKNCSKIFVCGET